MFATLKFFNMKSCAMKSRSKIKMQLHLILIFFFQKRSLNQFDQTCYELIFHKYFSVPFTAMNS